MTNHMFPYIILSHSKNKSNDTTTQLSIFNIEPKRTKVTLTFQHLKWWALKINPKP